MAKYIKEFFDNEYTDYAVYRIYQRLPHILDTLGQTQRKIIYSMDRISPSKKVKTAEVYSIVYTETQYLHGDASVFNVVENMARECSNNINLLNPGGSFGSRTNRSAASPRYTSTKLTDSARMIFKNIDKPIHEPQEFEGHVIEPKFLLPIVPINIINGYNSIAVGFASKFLPRHPFDVIDLLIDMSKNIEEDPKEFLKSYKPKEIQPAFPFYKGGVQKKSDTDSTWLLTGKIKRGKYNTIIIEDVPPEYTRESYIKKLKKMLEKGLIKNFDEACQKNSFSFSVKVAPEIFKKTDNEVLEYLNLVDTFTENFTFINPFKKSEPITKFDNVEDYLKIFAILRLKFYEKRKQYILENLQKEISILKEKIRFINLVNSNKIIITKRKKKDLIADLQKNSFKEIDSSFDYLLGMKMYALTDENVAKFKETIKQKEDEYNTLKNTSVNQIYIQELLELKQHLTPELKKKGLL